MYSDWLTYSVALCLTGVILDKLTVMYECIDWLITPVVAVSDWCNTELTDSDLHALIDWLPQ